MREIIISITPVLIGLLFGYFFGTSRDKGKVIFEKKLLVYSQVLSEIVKHSYSMIKIYEGSEIKSSSSRLEESNKLINLLAPARLLSKKKLENKLRDYYSLVVEFWDETDKTKEESIGKYIIKNVW